MLKRVLRSPRIRIAIALILIAIPVLVFYSILWKTAVELPILDDYDTPIGFGIRLHEIHGFIPRTVLLLTSEHNGYKVMFENTLFLAQYSLFGHIHLKPLIALGDAFALAIFLALALMAKDATSNVVAWLVALVPIAYLLFQLQYASALNFASCTLQHLPLIAFSLLAIYLLSRQTRRSFVLSCIASILAVASSPNGFFVAPVGLLMIIQQKQWKWLVSWGTLFLLMLGLYLFRYTAPAPVVNPGAGPTAPSHHINLVYALSFLGSSVARYSSILPSVLLGVLLCGIVGFATARGYFRQNAAVFYSMLFVLINAIAISGLRSDAGVAQSLASRYRIFSNLMLIFSYLFIAENLLVKWKSSVGRRSAFAAIAATSMLFCLLSDVAGARYLEAKKIALTQNYRVQWQKELTAGKSFDAETEKNPVLRRQMQAGIYDVNLPTMQESVHLGVYEPPAQP